MAKDFRKVIRYALLSLDALHFYMDYIFLRYFQICNDFCSHGLKKFRYINIKKFRLGQLLLLFHTVPFARSYKVYIM